MLIYLAMIGIIIGLITMVMFLLVGVNSWVAFLAVPFLAVYIPLVTWVGKK